jgi:DNA gyrase subunit A
VRIDETETPENEAEEAVVEEMLARRADDVGIATTIDRDQLDPNDEDAPEGEDDA